MHKKECAFMTDFTKANPDEFIPDMDRHRIKMNMSYQAVADACDVSQSTIVRFFKRQSTPTFDLIQKVSAAIKYEPHADIVLPKGHTVEAHIDFLERSLIQQKGDYERQLLQQDALFNRIHRQDRRTIAYLCAALSLVSVAFIIWLITH
jgi:transcriptional regulator with XRE-family HTH domain